MLFFDGGAIGRVGYKLRLAQVLGGGACVVQDILGGFFGAFGAGAAASGAEFGFFAEVFVWLTVGGTAFLAGALTTLGTATAVVDAFVAGAFFAGMEALFGVEVLVAAKALAGVADFVVLLGGFFLATMAGLGFAGAAFFAAAPLLAFEVVALVA